MGIICGRTVSIYNEKKTGCPSSLDSSRIFTALVIESNVIYIDSGNSWYGQCPSIISQVDFL